jgi:hypothetical protein
MELYVLDVVGKAYERTRKCLIEPFDFWKWLKLSVIVFLVGGGPNFGNSQNNAPSTSSDTSKIQIGEVDSIEHAFEQIGLSFDHVTSFPNFNLVIAGIILLLLFLIVLWYISSVMHFVLVDSLVKNDVRFWEYTKKYLRIGFDLFIIRFILFLLFFSLFIIAALPVILQLIDRPSGPDWLFLIPYILLIISLVIVIATIGAIINSFINLCIPLAMYKKTGIVSAFKKVLANFKADSGQIIIYWFGRIILWFLVTLLVGIVLFLAVIIIGAVLLLIDMVLYLILSALILESQYIIWIILAPIAFIQLIIVAVVMLMGSMPIDVFMKYHMLTFLDIWYPDAGIPFFDIEEMDDETPIQM